MDLAISTNCDEVGKLLQQLPVELREKYGTRGLREAAAITVSVVRNKMPVATGLARDSIGASPVKIYRDSGTLFCAIEPGKNFRRVVTSTATSAGKQRYKIRGRKQAAVTAQFGRVQDPRRYMHLIESGRNAVSAKAGSALHSALDPQNRFFANAAAVGPHPVFEPAKELTESAAVVVIENELNKGIEEFNRAQTPSVE